MFCTLSEHQAEQTWDLSKSLLGIVTKLSGTSQDVRNALSSLSSIPAIQLYLVRHAGTSVAVKESALASLRALTKNNELLAKKFVEKHDWIKILIDVRYEYKHAYVTTRGVLQNISHEMKKLEVKVPSELSDAIILQALNGTLYQSLPGRHLAEMDRAHQLQKWECPVSEQTLVVALDVIFSIARDLLGMLLADDDLGDFVSDDMEVEVKVDNVRAEEKLKTDHDVSTNDGIGEMIPKNRIQSNGSKSSLSTNRQNMVSVVKQLIIITALLVLDLLDTPQGQSSTTYDSSVRVLNNAAWCVSCLTSQCPPFLEAFPSWEARVQQIWDCIVVPVVTNDRVNLFIADLISNLAWATARSIEGRVKLSGDEHLKFIDWYQSAWTRPSDSQPPSTENQEQDQEDIIDNDLRRKCIGVLGALARAPQRIPINATIGRFFLSLLSDLPQTPTTHAIQVINQLFKIYAKKSYDYDEPVFWGESFLSLLTQPDVTAKLRAMVRAVDKEESHALKKSAKEAVRELKRFCRRKKAEKGDVASGAP